MDPKLNPVIDFTQSSHQKYYSPVSIPGPQGEFIDENCYGRAEKRANWYLTSLQKIANSDDFLRFLSSDYEQWRITNQQSSSSSFSLSALEADAHLSDQLDSMSFLQKLATENKLKDYLDKSISYIFMRDLGKSIADKTTQTQISRLTRRIHKWVKKQSTDKNRSEQWDSNLIYRKAKQAGVEETFFWLMNKLALVRQNMPETLDQTQGMRKLVKIIAGVVLHQFVDRANDVNDVEKKEKLDVAIRLGYYYGLTYPFVDDLQDSATTLNHQEKILFNQAIRESLLKGKVVNCPAFSAKNQTSMQFVYKELAEAFEYIKSAQSEENAKQFFEQAFIFFEAQDIDRSRKLSQRNYSTSELFLPIILKSAGCRLIAKEMLGESNSKNFDYRTFCFGIYNQFNDDIKDIFDDIEEDNVTPYTHYLKQQKLIQQKQGENSHLTNPYRIYWSVVFYLIYEVYQGDKQAKRLLLERSINAHKSLRNAIGEQAYLQLKQDLLKTGNHEFDHLIDSLVKQPNDVAWFDKLVSREVAAYFNNEKQQQLAVQNRLQSVKKYVDECLPVNNHPRLTRSTLVEAFNYSMQSGGKRLRAIMAYVMCVDGYHISPELTKPVLQLLEYMHTASIIFDDKPSQDNADLRRGRATLHQHYQCEATAELTGVYMMMRAVEVQSKMQGFKAERVLESLAYAASTTQAICEGQLLDLKATGQQYDINKLEKISELKTGLAIEASLMIPAILTNANDIEKGHLKQFAHHLGLAFQIKDDLLDVTESSDVLGKPARIDSVNDKATFVTCLGENLAQQKMFQHYYQAIECLHHLKPVAPFFKQILDFVVYRNH